MPRDIVIEGDGLKNVDFQNDSAVSPSSPVRKRGRPRKASVVVTSNAVLPTGAPHSHIPPTAGGGGQHSFDAQDRHASPNSSSAPKRGRPRKASAGAIPITTLPTGASIAETPQETAVGGGQRDRDDQNRDASPHFDEIGSDAVAEDAGHCAFDTHTRRARPSAPQTPPFVAVGGGQPTGDTHACGASPHSNTVAAVLDAGDGGEARAIHVMIPNEPVPDLAPLIEELITLQRERMFLIRTKNRMLNSTVAYVRRFLNFSTDMDEAERKKISAMALSIVQKVEKGKRLSDEERFAGIKCQHIIMSGQKARETFEKSLDAAEVTMPDGTIAPGIERQMVKLAKQLPVWLWAEGVKGFGALSLAVIIAETGDLSNYSNPGKVWKRLGLAPYKGKSGKTWRGISGKGGLTAEEWEWLGYSPARRSEMYQRQDPLLKHQVRKVKDADGNDTGERIAGPYGRVYLDRKKYELDRDPEMSKMHAHNRAARYMEKRLLKHLWQAWRRQPLTD